jgi:hypothetical protein
MEVKNVKTGLSKVVFCATAFFLLFALIAPGISATDISAATGGASSGSDGWTYNDPTMMYHDTSEEVQTAPQVEEQEFMNQQEPSNEMLPEEEIPPEMPIEELDPENPDVTIPDKVDARGKSEAPGQARKILRKSK